MVNLTTIKTALEGASFPFPITFKVGEQEFKHYPQVEIVDISESETQKPDTVQNETTLEIRLYYRFNRDTEVEHTDIDTIQTTIESTIQGLTFESGAFFFESRSWSESELSDVYGVVRKLRVRYTETTANESGTFVGAGTTFTIGGTVLSLIGNTTSERGSDFESAFDDTGVRYPIGGKHVHTRFFEYKYKTSEYNAVQTLISNRVYVTGALNEGGVITNFSRVLPVMQRDSMSFGGLKTVILQMEVQE